MIRILLRYENGIMRRYMLQGNGRAAMPLCIKPGEIVNFSTFQPGVHQQAEISYAYVPTIVMIEALKFHAFLIFHEGNSKDTLKE